MLLQNKILLTILVCACFVFPVDLFFIPKVKEVIKDIVKTVIFRNKCLGDLGCFKNGIPFYHPVLRPISLLPFDLKDINTKFWLYTPSTGLQKTLLVKNATFVSQIYDKKLSLKFLIHGYNTDTKGGDIVINKEIIQALLKTGRHNIIAVDWTDSNLNPYPQAVANGRVVGAQIAKMVEFLQKSVGVDPKNVHIIGHSLGSHVAGWAGERIPKLGRITGLDPAGPYFRLGVPKIRLDSTDALFVDVIHTNGAKLALKGLGIEEPIGHIDFYPNGGEIQPGCVHDQVNITTSKDGEIVEFGSMGCDHFRAVEYFTASISDCKFEGTQCSTYKLYKAGKCQAKTRRRAMMGYHTEKSSGVNGLRFFLDTTSEYPFCK